MRKLLTIKAIIATLAIATFGVGSAFASVDVSGGNSTTGPNSENHNTWKINSNSKIILSNHSTETNNIGVVADSGHSHFSDNTTIGDIVLGGIMGNIDLTSSSSNMDPVIDLGDMGIGDVSIDFGNSTTGPNSDNHNSANIDSSSTLKITNCKVITNAISASLKSGDNSINHNTVVGNVSGGNISYTVSATNPSSSGPMIVGTLSPQQVSVTGDLSNSITGPNSDNSNTVNVHSNNLVDISNHSTVSNNISVSADTGHTTVGHNTTVGDVTTGDASVSISVQN